MAVSCEMYGGCIWMSFGAVVSADFAAGERYFLLG